MKLTPFGKAVRGHRLEKEITLGDMAAHLSVSSAFASGVETGSKGIPEGYADKVAAFLDLSGGQRAELLQAAMISGKEIKIPLTDKTPRADKEVAAMFARRFPGMSDAQRAKLKSILEED